MIIQAGGGVWRVADKQTASLVVMCTAVLLQSGG